MNVRVRPHELASQRRSSPVTTNRRAEVTSPPEQKPVHLKADDERRDRQVATAIARTSKRVFASRWTDEAS